MIQLMVASLNGTLIQKNRPLAKETATAIKQLQKKGIQFVINTSLDYPLVEALLAPHKISCDVISSGGSCTFDKKGNIVRASYLPMEQIPDVLRLLGKHCIFYELYSTNGRLILGAKEAYENYITGEYIPALLMEDKDFSMTNESFELLMDQTKFYDHGELMLRENPQIYKICASSNNSWKLSNLKEELHNIIPNFAVSENSPYHIEVGTINALKGTSLRQYMKDNNINPKNVLVLGGLEDDYSMLGLPFIHSVATKDAAPIIQDICEHQLTGNEDAVSLIKALATKK